jgi:hypothetical protein
MAKKKETKLSRDLLDKIWESIDVMNWLDLLQEHKRSNQFTIIGVDNLRGLCLHPDHSDHSPSFYLSPGQHRAKCFGCGRYYSNPVEVASLIYDLPLSETLQKLQERFTLAFLPNKVIEQLEAQRVNQATKQEIFDVAHMAMCNALSSDKPEEYTRAAVEWLTKERRIAEDTLHALPIGILPPLTSLLVDMTNLYKKREEKWTAGGGVGTVPINLADYAQDYLSEAFKSSLYTGAVVWPLHVSPNEIGKLKLRVPHNNDPKQINILDDPFEDYLGLYGLGWPHYKELMDTHKEVFVTEGEMDVMSLMSEWVKTNAPKFILVSAGGTSNSAYIERILRNSGFEHVSLIGDAPSKNGPTVVQDWLGKINKLNTKIFTGWDALSSKHAEINDLDKATTIAGEQYVCEIIWDKKAETFTYAWRWAADNALEEMVSLLEDDTRGYLDTAAKHGKYLKNNIDCARFIECIYAVHPDKIISKDLLKREIAVREDSESGFVLRCSDAIEDIFQVISTDGTASQKNLIVFDKNHKSFSRLRLDSDVSTSQEMALISGGIIDFVDSRVGFPNFMVHPSQAQTPTLLKVDKALCSYVTQAFKKLAKDAPPLAAMTKISQGYHRHVSHDGSVKEYIVCGTDVFTIDHKTEDTATYKKLEGPTDGNIFFDLGFENQGVKHWLPGGMTVDKLNKYNDVDTLAVYEELVKLLENSFRFKHHDNTSRLYAALLMILPVFDAFLNQIQVHIIGQSKSGKSHLLALASGLNAPEIQLVYPAQGWTEFTEAGLAYACNNSSLVACLDEFEVDGERSRHVRAVRELCRGLITSGVIREVRSKEGLHRVMLRMPVLMASITCAEKEQDMNRLLLIEAVHVDGLGNPRDELLSKYTPAQYQELAMKISLGMYRRVPELVRHYEVIRSSFQEMRNSVPFNIEQRSTANLYGILAFMRMLGLDWMKFFVEYSTLNSSMIQRTTTVSEAESTLSAMLRRSVIFIKDNQSTVSLASLLANEEQRDMVNTSGCGVYFDKDQKLLLVLPEQAIPRLFQGDERRDRGMTVNRMKDLLSRHKMALTPVQVERSGILRKIVPFMGAGIRETEVVVVHASAWLTSTPTAQENQVREGFVEPETNNGKEQKAESAQGTKDIGEDWG